MAFATETPSLVILGPPKLCPEDCQLAATQLPALEDVLTNDDSPSLGSQSRTDGLRQDINTPQHTLSSIVSKNDILRCVTPLCD